MSQEYTEDRQIKFAPMGNKRRLIEALLILVALFAVYLMVALFSFNPSDPSWSQTAWHEPIHNLGGIPGAWLADTLLFVFGVMAYAMPVVIMGLCLAALRYRRHAIELDYFTIALRLIGALTLIVTTCGLAAMNADDIWSFTSGGVIGSLINSAISGVVSQLASVLILLCLWAAGFTLYTGWSWLILAEKIGEWVLTLFTFVSHRGKSRANIDPDFCHSDNSLFRTDPAYAATLSALDEDPEASSLVPHQKISAASLDPSLRVLENQRNQAAIPHSQHKTAICTNELDYSIARQTHIQSENQSENTDAPLNYTQQQIAENHPSLESQGAEPQWPQSSVTSAKTTEQALHPTQQADRSAIDPSSGLNNQSAFALAASMGKLNSVSVKIEPTISALNRPKPQVKRGIGPEMPRPNPVKIPSRRELASYGIKLPSQRQEPDLTATPASIELTQAQQDLQDEMQQANLAAEFAHLQKSRYGYPETEAFAEKDNLIITTRPDPKAYTDSAYPYSEPRITAELPSSSHLDRAPLVSHQSPEKTQSQHDFQSSDHLDDATQSNTSANTGAPASLPAKAAVSAIEDPVEKAKVETSAFHDSLLHPFLMRNDAPLEKPSTPLPTLLLLTAPAPEATPVDRFALEQTARLVEARLNDFRVKAEVVEISPGPVITRYELDLAPGVKAARISNLSRDLARSLSAVAVRVVEVIPGKPYVGLELPNLHRQTVYLREVLDCPAFRDDPSPLTIVLGKDISGAPVVADLAKMPHLLVAGTTGSGKSVGVNAMILSMLYKATPQDVRFIMIDPKMLELSVYEGIPHLLTEVVTDMKDAANALRWSVSEMERRYKLMSALGVRNLAGYNERVAQAEAMGRPIPDPFWKPSDSMDLSPQTLEKLPYIVVMVDEFADLMMAVGKKVEELIARLAQKARAAGIHLVLATQRPSVDVITGLIKANIPTRIAFTVSSKIDSRTILDQAGAESLLGMGDMLYLPPNSSMPVRVHGAFVRDQEVHAVVQDWKARGRPQYIENITTYEETDGGNGSAENSDDLDPLFDQAVAFVVDKRRASISGVQRQFRIGYNRAARIIEQMEGQGIVSEPGNNGNREVLAPPSHSI